MNEIHTTQEIPECIRFKCLDEPSECCSDDPSGYEEYRKQGIKNIIEDEQVCEKHGLQKGFTTIYLDGNRYDVVFMSILN